MSGILNEHEQICKSPVNNSKSKFLYSFSKAVRFQDDKNTKTVSASKFYDLPSFKSDRSAFIGYGTKYDFTKENKDKCQVFYNIAQDFNPKTSNAPCYSFGLGRSYFDKVYYETNKSIDKNIPGPAKYNILKPFGSDSAKFSIVAKNDKNGFTISKSKYPGPGEYKSLGINDSGKFPLSNFTNIPTIKFGLNKEERFKKAYLNNVPSPDSYNIKPLIGSDGTILSTMKASPKIKIIGKGKDLTDKYTNKKSKL